MNLLSAFCLGRPRSLAILFIAASFSVSLQAQLAQGSSAPTTVTTVPPGQSAPENATASKTIFLRGQVLVDDLTWDSTTATRPVIQANCNGVRASSYAEKDGT